MVALVQMTIIFMFRLASLLMTAGCGTGSSLNDGREQVVAAFYPLAFAAERIGDGHLSVTNLTRRGLSLTTSN
jgi:zinc transport system substrate-binding protein